MGIENIVNVNITRETASVSRQGFGIPMILGTNKSFTELIKYYTKLSQVAEDFFITDAEYLAAQAMFSQSPSPVRVGIARRASADTSVITVTAQDNFVYKVKVNGQTATYTSGVSETAAAIAAQLKTAIDALSEPVTVTDNLDGTLDIAPTVPSTAYALSADSANIAIAFTTSQTVIQDLDAILIENSDWYSFMMVDRTQANVESAMSWVETNFRLFVAASDDANIADQSKSADNTSIAFTAQTNAYTRTAVFYHSQAADEYPDAGLIARIAPLTPGSYTAKFLTLVSIPVDNITPTQETNLKAKNVNYYNEVGGRNITCDGKVSEGEFIDTIVFVDWLRVNITADVFTLFVNNDKIPFTDEGIAGIEGAIVARLQIGVANGGIAPDDGNDPPGLAYTVTVPRAIDVSQEDKANRILRDVEFTAILAGAIHATIINGTVTV